MTSKTRVVCFGELLLRFTAPGREYLLQSPQLGVNVGGAEANVAVALARLGVESAMVSVIPAANALGDAAVGEVRRHGVDCSGVRAAPGRMGLYFLTQGAAQRPSEILYDRADSAFAKAPDDLIEWSGALAGAGWLHISGITPAVSASAADAALRAVKAARALGVRISMDCNYRAKLWEARAADPRPILSELMAHAELIFAEHRDIELATGQESGPGDEHQRRAKAAEIAFAAFPSLERIASTVRKTVSVDHNRLSGVLITRAGQWTTQEQDIFPIIDRIGGGDAFAAGVLFGVLQDWAEQATLDFALAAACLKHSIPGDFNLASEQEIRGFLSESRFDVRR